MRGPRQQCASTGLQPAGPACSPAAAAEQHTAAPVCTSQQPLSPNPPCPPAGIAEKLLWKSATLQGFFLLHYASQWRRHIKKLAGLLQDGRLRIQVRPGQAAAADDQCSRGAGAARCKPHRSAARLIDCLCPCPPQMDAKRFVGLEAVADAVDWLQSGRSAGKVYVQIARELPPAGPSRL